MTMPRRRGQSGSILILTTVVLFAVLALLASMLTLSVSSHVSSRVNHKRAVARALADGAIELGKDWIQTQFANQSPSALAAMTASTMEELADEAKWTPVAIDEKPARFAIVAIPPTLDPVPTAASLVQFTPDKKGWSVDGPDGVRTFHYLYAVVGRGEDGTKKTLGDSTIATA